MPIYEFVCQSCGSEFEQIRSFSDNSVPTCSVCGSEQVVRRMGRPAIHFKGSGWYITDSKKSGKESAVGGSNNGEKKPEGSAGSTEIDSKGAETKSTEAKSTEAKGGDSKSPAKRESAKAAAE